ncbi:DUF4157 domain-containing protein [Streptomyces sp. NPDC060184]|uniref:eCIS core domain-containing protein n=1 Tax=Streptomyces sp. NPDC060184 TaxID=3347064 RepID=UPI003647C6C5
MPATASAAAVLDLQRLAGNAAVTRALGGDHEHGAGCDHGTPVQRSSVLDVLRTPGSPVDPRIRAKAEQGLGTDLGDVRVHDGPEAHRSAAELGARAYTSGRHIVAGRQGLDEHTLLHELTHTWQQQRGQVAGTDNGAGLRVSAQGDRHENEAESYAHLLAKVPAPTAGDGERVDGERIAGERVAGERVGGGPAFGERPAPASAHTGASVQRAPERDAESGAVQPHDYEQTKRALKLLASIVPESVPLLVQAIGNGLAEDGAKVYASGVALNGAVGLGEIVKGCYDLRKNSKNRPAAFRVLFGLLNLGSAVLYGVSQLSEPHAKAIQSSTGAALQGLSYIGIIATSAYAAVDDVAKFSEFKREQEAAGVSTAVSLHPGQNVPRRRRGTSAAPSVVREPSRASSPVRVPSPAPSAETATSHELPEHLRLSLPEFEAFSIDDRF